MKNYNFAILGCGVISKTHALAINEIPNATLVGVADNNAEYARAFAQKNGVKAYESYQDMLADKDIDVVCICTPSGFHASNAIDALNAGKHVILEKPMSISNEWADKVIEACERTGKKLTVISQFRFSEDIKRVKKLIEENVFGKISLCTLTMKYYRNPEYYSSSSWRGTLRFDGGGALINQGIHGVDMLDYILGPITNVKGKIATISHNIEGEDTAVAFFQTESGALGVIQASTCAYPGFDRRIEIHGDKGYVCLLENKIEKLMVNGEMVDLGELNFTSTANDNTVMDYRMHKAQFENFINGIEGKEKILVDCYEGKKALAIIQNIYQTSKEIW
jgi:predicted dehydrogenase